MTKLEANRANAQYSTGPLTDAGKTRSSRNAISHGLQSIEVVLAHENPGDFDRMLQHYESRVDLSDPEQAFFADQITQAQWRLRRIQRLTRLYHDLEVTGFSENPSPDEIIVRNMEQRSKDVPATLHRHEMSFQRLWWRFHKQLEAIREQQAGQSERSAARSEPSRDQRERSAELADSLENMDVEEPPIVMTPEDFADQLDDEDTAAFIEDIENIERQRRNPIPWCHTFEENYLLQLPPAHFRRFASAIRARAEQTNPDLIAA